MELINTTTVFEENQVLTAGQLNTMQDFLFQENRLTRTRLIGRGIAYGLEVNINSNQVNIAKGVGVTSWGFLISLGDCNLTHYKEYKLPEGLIYPYFMDGLGNDVPLLELFTAENALATGAKQIDSGLILSNYIVLLFLEPATKNLQSCLGKSCDDLGIEKTFTVRKLLITIDDLNKINASNANRGGAKYPALYNLETINYPRALITPAEARNYADLVNSYLSPVAAILADVTNQLEIIFKELPILQRNFQNTDIGTIRANWENKLMDLASKYLNGTAYGFQYVYDAFEDIIKSYEELRCAAMHLNSSTLPNADAFPMHLMLGSIDCPPSINRQEFEYSPLFNEHKDWSKKVVSIFGRTMTMLDGYFDDLTEKGKKGVLATPSKEKWQNIGKRTLPIYFDPNNSDFEKYWNESLCHGCDNGKPLSYHYQLPLEAQEYGLDKLSAPLFYNFNDQNFFRLEGHLSLDQATAVNQYKKMQRRFNLPLKVRSIFMGVGGSVTSNCRYPDLDSQYLAWRNLMLYYLNNLIKYSNLAENMAGRFDDVVDAAKDAFDNVMGNEKEPAAESPNANGATAEAPKVNVDKVKTFATLNKNFIKMGTVSEKINRTDYTKITTIKVKAEDAKDDIEKDVLNWISRFNANIEDLISLMTLEFSDFKDQEFKMKYTGFLDLYVDAMKTLVSIINKEKDKELLSYLMIGSLIHRALNVIMIRPYVTIGTIMDTRKQRNSSLNINKSLADYLRDSAAEHLAGAERGNTLLLLYHTGKESEIVTRPQVSLGNSRLEKLSELKLAEDAIHATYKVKLQSIQEVIKTKAEDIKRAEFEVDKALEVKVAEVKNRVVLNEDQIKKGEEELNSELLTRKKALFSTTNSETISKAEESLKKEFEDKVNVLRKSAIKDENKEIKEVSNALKIDLENKRIGITEEIDKKTKEEMDTQQEYQSRLDLLNIKRKAVEEEKDDVLEEVVVAAKRITRNKFLTDFETKFNKEFNAMAEKIGDNGLKNLGANVIADFTVYEDDSCCDCNPKDAKNKELTPLAVPISRIVAYNQSKATISKVQVLNNLYHPDFYEVAVKSDPKYGAITFEEEVYEPMPDKKRQVLVYTLDPKNLDRKSLSQMVVIDEFDYVIKEKETGEEVGASKLSFFIAVGTIAQQEFELSGRVTGVKAFTITARQGDALIKTQQFTGSYYNILLQLGQYQITVTPSVTQYPPQNRTVKIEDKDNFADFEFGKV
ncbi:hypothetical protein EZ449_08600 [Pedobacter frigidisoli]|uniref:Uncharacterized protein n=1 Tax=Pedobacter frigidisoli TaxID=2530455 RepID=A0A4V2MMW6_9SPHI|nr:hypothetical protein [Pedobacter frigidisoli]TCD10401.1 hypothetical protein EZ449_08600 [Pedobacter frigidisoli]